MYKRVLLAYDGTLEGAMALREGAILAKRCEARVYVLSVVPQGAGVAVAEGVNATAYAYQNDNYKALLGRAVSRLEEFGLKPVGRLAAGEPVKAIVAFAKEVGADLVVVGHQKRSLLERWWSGSTGSYISDYLGCSILIARTGISDEAFAAAMGADSVET